MTDYAVIYEHANDGSWSVRAVDLPVYSMGDTREGAATSMRQALALFLERNEPPASLSRVGTVRV